MSDLFHVRQTGVLVEFVPVVVHTFKWGFSKNFKDYTYKSLSLIEVGPSNFRCSLEYPSDSLVLNQMKHGSS